MDEAEQVRVRAMESGQLNAAVAAIKEKGVLSGKRIERSEVGGPGEFDHLSDEELVLPRARVVPRPLTELDPETAKLIENLTVDSKGRLIPKLYSKTWANAELRKMLNIGGRKEREQTDLSRLSDAELIQRLADQAKELGIEIDLSYSFAQPKKTDE
jgi:hypothetical protein